MTKLKAINNSYDFGTRLYDPRVGRFNSIDPLHRKFSWYSPYLFAGNTPIMAGDESGLYPIVRGGKIVGYVIEPGQGPTQIAEDINNPNTQEIFGYCLQDKVQWEEVVQQNNGYYESIGDWKDSDMYDANNPVYKNLNSNVGDIVSFNMPKDEVVAVVQQTKNISEPEGIVGDTYLNVWGEGQGTEGWASAIAKGNEKIHYMNYDDVGFSSPKRNLGLTKNSNPKNYDFINAIKAWVKGVTLLSGKKDIKAQKKEVEKEVTIKIPDFEKGMQWQRANEHTSNMIGDYSTKDTLVKEKEEDKIKNKYRKRKNDSIKKNIDNR